IDLSVGIVLNKKVGDKVNAGESILTIHSNKENVNDIFDKLNESIKIDSEANIYKAGNIFINDIGSKGVVIKGGHSEDPNIAKDYLFTKDDVYTFENQRFNTPHTHGTGCTFSAVIAAELAKGRSIYEAVKKAKKFISLSIEYTPEIGQGRGPVNHFAYLKKVGLDDE
ncbi:MAG: bifunctional hydroxymethylpyrimidine kinase/phosphomethylpyrimidine kinase, partial [Staphylococcus lugdunensis]|nr:bifunctional hydroxymethylpyrimidine kinase/phosphomethylpyrimidine kinase [Staphylococcus lugdunensis]